MLGLLLNMAITETLIEILSLFGPLRKLNCPATNCHNMGIVKYYEHYASAVILI